MTEAMLEGPTALLARLSQKPGVQSALILSRETGAVLRTTGLISSKASANPNNTLSTSQGDAGDLYTTNRAPGGLPSAEDVAKSAWTFVKAAEDVVDSLYQEDEPRLLRLRTKKHELLIVPGTRLLWDAVGTLYRRD